MTLDAQPISSRRTETPWWKRGVVYQIYPRSFQDTDRDGVGDLQGIRQRLDYLAWLGVDAIWISPIYPSPMADFGYDVADYCDVDPIFGTLEEFDDLIADAHRRGLKLILDFVPNHTSDRHAWFLESRSSRENPKRDWYLWRDPKPDGSPPNNWVSNFGGSAWTFDEPTGQYYYHAFLREQPDLNWRNPAVREAMHAALRFWLKRGVDGFRVDVLWHLIKDAEFRDNPPNPGWTPAQAEINRFLQLHNADQPEVLEVVEGMRRVIDEYDDRVLIGEIYLPLERLVAYYGKDLSGAHLPFNLQLIHTAWNATAIAALVAEYEAAIPEGGWPNWVLGNHDQARIAARVGAAQARIAAMLLLTLRGTPTMYYADEIGLAKVEVPPDRARDPWERNEPGLGLGRDPARTPMQWTPEPKAGFTEAQPWLPLDREHDRCNVATLREDTASILTLYRRLIALRRDRRALSVGSYSPGQADGDVLSFERRHDARLRVILNFGHEPRTAKLPDDAPRGRLLLSTRLDREGEEVGPEIALRADEGVIVELQG
jgi:alpha-glucosidase